jgi:hypothetical protein
MRERFESPSDTEPGEISPNGDLLGAVAVLGITSLPADYAGLCG